VCRDESESLFDMKKRREIFLVVILLFFILFIWKTKNGISQSTQIPPTPYSQEDIQRLESLLSQSGLDDIARASLEEKLGIAKRMVTGQILAMNNPAIQAAALLPTPLSAGDPPFESGIFDGDEGLFRPEIAHILNYWQGRLGDGFVQVFAGAEGRNSKQGLVVVVKISKDRMKVETIFVRAPGLHGALAVMAEQNLKLRLLAEGDIFYDFNIATQSFTENE
jgi:hypothetical protein